MYSLRDDIVDAARVILRNLSWVAAVLAVLADILTTLAAISVGGVEANPLLATAVNANPDTLWLIGGAQMVAFAVFGWIYFGRRDRVRPYFDSTQWTLWVVFAGIAAFRFAVAASNLAVYNQLA